MIFTKNTVFPYPLYYNDSTEYNDPKFEFDIEVSEREGYYSFQFTYELESEYLDELISDEKAKLSIIMTTPFESKIMNFENPLIFSVEELNLSSKIRFQCFISAQDNLSFEHNSDLVDYYFNMKSKIKIPKNGILAFSNTVNFNGEIKKPFEIFEWQVDEELKTEMKIDLATDKIIVKIKNKDYRIPTYLNMKSLNNHYVYIGLQKAIYEMLSHLASDSDGEIDLGLDFDDLPATTLEIKLLNFMKAKKVTKLSRDNVDEVISQISNNIISKQANDLRKIIENGN